jgi:hypothetical protein
MLTHSYKRSNEDSMLYILGFSNDKSVPAEITIRSLERSEI